jgi:hypothetical protein
MTKLWIFSNDWHLPKRLWKHFMTTSITLPQEILDVLRLYNEMDTATNKIL